MQTASNQPKTAESSKTARVNSITPTTPVGQRNPFFDNPPGPIKSRVIRETGSDQDRAWLAEWQRTQLSDTQKEALDRAAQYGKELVKETKGPSSETQLKQSLARMFSLMSRGMAKQSTEIVEDIIIIAKRLLWEAYRGVVYKGRGSDPVIEAGSHVQTVLTASVYWLLGVEAPEGVRGFDPRKSLYFAGSTGNGKSSIAKAIHFASMRLQHDYQIGEGLGIRSMKRVVTDVLADNNLASIKDLSGGSLVLDEIRTEHITLKHYGNEVSIVSDVLYNRYDSWDFDGHRTVITTNLTPKALCDQLGDDRLKDRLNDQYQLVKFTGEPFRDTQMSQF